MRDVLEHETDGEEVFLALETQDVRDACDLLRSILGADRSPRRAGVVRSRSAPGIRPAPHVAEAKRLHQSVGRQNLYVKIPAMNAWVGAITDTIAAGIPVNVTLIFSLKRHRKVIDAYLTGLERLIDHGGDPADVRSVASFFVSRVDTETDRRLDALGGHDQLRSQLGIANAKLAYEQYRATFTGVRWDKLKTQGARPQRCLWASTSVKDPRSCDTMYVEQLAGAQTVNTMPPETLSAVQDHGTLTGQTIDRDL